MEDQQAVLEHLTGLTAVWLRVVRHVGENVQVGLIEMAFHHEVIEWLKERCCCCSKEAWFITLSWDLACSY